MSRDHLHRTQTTFSKIVCIFYKTLNSSNAYSSAFLFQFASFEIIIMILLHDETTFLLKEYLIHIIEERGTASPLLDNAHTQ